MRLLCLFIAMTVILSGCKPAGEADALLVDGRAVDPLCFAPYLLGESQGYSIALRDCGAGYVADDGDTSMIEGYLSTGFRYEGDESGGMMRPAFIAYRLVGVLDDGALAVEVLGSGGGTGVFSTLLKARREGDALRVEDTYAGGDRCNGGITEATVGNGVVSYGVSITPYDFMVLDGKDDPVGIKAYDDLDACAACCMGEALYRTHRFQGVRISENFVAPDRPTEQSIQICFDALIAAQSGKTLSAAQYVPLRDRVQNECAP